MEVGAVAAMRFVKDGIRAARLVMQHTKHTLLVGESASAFAISMGLPGPTNLSSKESIEKWTKWKENLCQPNFWKNVENADGCGPYKGTADTCSKPSWIRTFESRSAHVGRHSHDTISMAVIDKVIQLLLFSYSIYIYICIYLSHFISCSDGPHCCWYIYEWSHI